MQDIDRKDCWCIVNTITRQDCFFRALKQFSGGGRRLYIEGYVNPVGQTVLDPLTIDAKMTFDIGSIDPRPNSVFHFEMTDPVLDALSTLLADRQSDVDQVAVYSDLEFLLVFCDAFMENSIVDLSRSLGSEQVRRFCEILGVSLQESRDVYPELFEEGSNERKR